MWNLFSDLSKFQNKLTLLLVTGILSSVGFVGGYSAISSSSAVGNLASKQIEIEAKDSYDAINLFLNNARSDLLFLSKSPPVPGIVRARDNGGIDPNDGSTYESWVNRFAVIISSFVNSRQYYDKIRFIDENGNELIRVINQNGRAFSVPKNQLQNQANSYYFRDAMNLPTGEIYVSPIDLNRENGVVEIPHKPTIRYAIPIYNTAGNKRGILVVNILVEKMLNLGNNQILEDQLNQKFLVINDNGFYVVHPETNKRWGSDLGHQENFKRDYDQEIVNQVFSGGSGIFNNITQNNENFMLSYYTVFPELTTKRHPFILIYQTPHRMIFAPINELVVTIIIITLVSVITIVIIGYFILRRLVSSVSNTTNVVSTFSNQFLVTIEEQERTASQQSASVQQTTVTMDELSTSSQQSAQQAQAALESAKQSLELVENGSEGVKFASEAMTTLKQKVEDIALQISRLSDQTNQIGSVSNLVSDIANQTNMLALNAAVEAVRAGENGKGFSVVAAEIRKLADQSRNSAQQIGGLVNDIQKAIQSTVTVIKEGTKQVNKGSEIAQQTAQIFLDIAAAMEQIVENTQQIALNSKQQADATQQVTQTMNTLTQGAIETVKGIGQTKTGTQQLNQAAAKLKAVV
jgi:methyl-accepting chemotaxis protein